MLATTVQYLNVLETKRHNLVSESQQKEQIDINRFSANVQAGQLEETKRHNRVTEEISWGNLHELERHNTVQESINEFDANTRRYQIAINQFEADTHRYAAVQNAGIGWANVAVNQGQLAVSQTRAANDYDIGLKNAAINLTRAETEAKKQQEDVRWHDVSAGISEQSNELRSQELDWNKSYQQQKLNIDKANMIWRNTLDTIDTASNLFHNLASDVSHETDKLLPDNHNYFKKGKKKK